MAEADAVLATEPIFADDEFAGYCPDLDGWPLSWRYEARDEAPGQQMVECFKPFLRHLLSRRLARKTLRRHRDNLWLLGGALIRNLHQAPRLRKRPIIDVVRQAIDEEGGPLICHGVLNLIGDDGGPLLSHGQSEAEQRSFDATCRRFYRFLTDRNSSQRRAVDLWTTLKKRCPQAHSPQQMQNQPADDTDQKAEFAEPGPPTDSPEEAIKKTYA
jgi:hypothetical protein